MTNLEKRQLRLEGRDPDEVHRQRLEALTGPIQPTDPEVPDGIVDDILIVGPGGEIDTRPPSIRRRFGGMRGVGGLISLMLLTGMSGIASGAYPPFPRKDD